MAIYKLPVGPVIPAQRVNGVIYRPSPGSSTMYGWGSPRMHPSPRFTQCDAQARAIDETWHNLTPTDQLTWTDQATYYRAAPTPPCVPHRKITYCDIWDDYLEPLSPAAAGQQYFRGVNMARIAMAQTTTVLPPAPYLQTDSTYMIIDAGPPITLWWADYTLPLLQPLWLQLYGIMRRQQPSWMQGNATGEFIFSIPLMREYRFICATTIINRVDLDLSPWLTPWRTSHPGSFLNIVASIGIPGDACHTSQWLGIAL